MDSEGASSVLASVAYRLATNPDFSAELQQEGGFEALTHAFPALSVEEYEALQALVTHRHRLSLHGVPWKATSTSVEGRWWVA